ncbi:hypothetical protein RCL1_008064 [Eukaryota sp. TZLM3-RCL]
MDYVDFLENSYFEDIQALNTMGISTLRLSKFVMNQMKEAGIKGVVITVSSICSQISLPYSSVYSAVKSFTDVLSRGIFWEAKRFGIDVCCVRPGPVNTNFRSRVEKSVKSQYFR